MLGIPGAAFASEGIHPAGPRAEGRTASSSLIPGIRDDHAVFPASLLSAIVAVRRSVPSFSRQTGLACSACHYQFPQLTPFGRLFKLNGYTLTGLQTIGQPGDSGRRESLKLLPIPPLSAMVVTSVTQTATAQPGAQNGTVVFPQQLSAFLAGAITPKMGAFVQLTYSAADATLGIDNADIRYATRTTLANRDLLFGLTVNNNPTVQDPWNTVPAWGFPYMSSSVAPEPIASTLIDGGLGQSVLGFGAYSLYDNVLYADLTAYRSAPQGAAQPADTTSSNTTRGVIPYWRVALQHDAGSTYMMVGTYGFDARLYPTGVTGPTNHFTDVAADAQVEHKSGAAVWIGHASFIHERQQLEAFALATPAEAQNLNLTLSTFRMSVAYEPSLRYAFTLGYAQTSGTRDSVLYAPAPMTGSRTGSPNTSGMLSEIDYNPWQNTRVGLQYTAYGKFNGASSAYDVVGGRRASDNNPLYLYLWWAF
jgi:hypothetical protein